MGVNGLIKWDINAEFCPSKPRPDTCHNDSPVHLNNTFTKIESHSKADKRSAPGRIPIKKLLYVDSLESSPIILYLDQKCFLLSLCSDDND